LSYHHCRLGSLLLANDGAPKIVAAYDFVPVIDDFVATAEPNQAVASV
jgi:hypothetical protein